MAAKQAKYSKVVRGGYSARSFANHRLPSSVVCGLVEAANASLSKNTWTSYKTAENHLLRAEKATGVRIRMPMTNTMVLAYIGYLLTERKVSGGTISQYLSGLRIVHLKHGVLPHGLRPDIVQSIIKGTENLDRLKDKKPRLAVTLPVLKLLKESIRRSKMSTEKKRMMWAVACLAFNGSFRIHEILSRKKTEYEPLTTLMGKDMVLRQVQVDGVPEDVLSVNIKMPKAGMNICHFAGTSVLGKFTKTKFKEI